MSSSKGIVAACVASGIVIGQVAAAGPVDAQAAAASTGKPSHCVLHRSASSFSGSCGLLFGEEPIFTLSPAAAVASGVWRSDVRAKAAWVGSTSGEDGRKFPAELELYADQHGILRTEYGWFAVSRIVSGATLSFELNASREIKPEALDEKIVERAAALLSSASAWNRQDNRTCPESAATWSIYCALQKATIEVTGAANHRRPAMEAVRTLVDERSIGRNYRHRLMDYNNDPTTSLEAVRSLFKEALAGMGDPQWLAQHGFATSSAW